MLNNNVFVNSIKTNKSCLNIKHNGILSVYKKNYIVGNNKYVRTFLLVPLWYPNFPWLRLKCSESKNYVTAFHVVVQMEYRYFAGMYTCMQAEIDSRSDKISDKFFVPNILRNVVWDSRRVEWWAFSTLATDTVGLLTR